MTAVPPSPGSPRNGTAPAQAGRVLVLMSTWNGIGHVEEQVASILGQEFAGEVRLLVRDDGSRDGTVDYLNTCAPDRVRVIAGDNLGAKASFLELLRHAQDEAADFVALADQDDVWRPEKLAAAVARLDPARPMLYASALDLVDGDLAPIGHYVHPGDRSFASTLLCNFVTGCTCVMTRAMLEILPFPGDPQRIMMHDWWLAMAAAALGEVVYDPASHIAHRQHGRNQIGIGTGIGGLRKRVVRMLAAPGVPSRVSQAEEFARCARDRLRPGDRATLDAFLSAGGSLPARAAFATGLRGRVGAVSALRYVAKP